MSLLRLKPSELARSVLQLKGKPLNLEEYLPFRTVYDVNPRQLCIMAGRQIGKSVSLGGAIIAQSIIRPFFNTLFVSPLAIQTSRFSTTYLGPFLNSPLIKKHFVSSVDKKDIFQKGLNNGSNIFLSYAETEGDADRIRGIPADMVLFDECQDLQGSEALAIIFETLSASDYGFKRLTGTAKTENNILTSEFKKSCMAEWAVKCDHCGKHTIPLDFDTCMKITENPLGPGCIYCGKVLNMKNGKWVAAKPNVKQYLGFHMPQIIIPARTGIGTEDKPGKWLEIRSKIYGSEGARGYSTQKIANEIFGLASGQGMRILSMTEAMACCNSEKTAWDTGFPRDSRNINVTVLGCDWSVTSGDKSYTVFSVLGYDWNGKCHLLYSQRLNGIDLLEQVKRAEQLYHQYDCSMIGSDRGCGQLQYNLFVQHLGQNKVCAVNYVAAKTHLRWDKQGVFYAADRTMNMDTMVLKIKLGSKNFETPCYALTADFWSDALNVHEEVTQAGRRVYRKEEDLTDDWLHSIVFANVAYMVLKGDFVYTDDTPSHSDSLFDIDNFIT